MNKNYTNKFYRDLTDGSYNSAIEVVPMIIALFKPESVLDLGCGIGTWLKVFSDCGVQDVLGVDGDYVSRSQLMIPEEWFMPYNLSEPFRLNRKFDLALSLEVAEHLTEEKSDTLVDTLVAHAPVVLFSASIPFQGGTNHLNEQWQSYWARKFISRGYYPSTYLRNKIWHLPHLLTCYRQNMMIYVDESYCQTDFNKYIFHDNIEILDVVHPELYEQYANPAKLRSKAFKAILNGLPRLIKTMFKDVINRGKS